MAATLHEHFDVHVTVHRDKFLYNKPNRCTKFTNLFWKETLHISDRMKMELQFHPDPARQLSTNLYDIYHCCVCKVKKS